MLMNISANFDNYLYQHMWDACLPVDRVRPEINECQLKLKILYLLSLKTSYKQIFYRDYHRLSRLVSWKKIADFDFPLNYTALERLMSECDVYSDMFKEKNN